MRKKLFLMLGALLSLPTLARDFEFTYEGQTLTYTVVDEEDKTCMTKAGNNDDEPCSGNNVTGDLAIPSKINDGVSTYTVISIGEMAFYECSNLKSVSIPESVTSIGEDAFEYCDGLEKAEFASIDALCNIDFGNTDSNPLYYAQKLYIEGNEVTDLVIPEGIKSIGFATFANCKRLTSVSIPASVISIGEMAFGGCIGLKKADFASIESLCKIHFGGQLTFGAFVSNPLYLAKNLYVNGKEVTDVVIPEGVTSVGMGTFYGCTNIISVTIPGSVTSIDATAFCECSRLTSVKLAEGLTSIGIGAFAGCGKLTSITIPSSVTSIGDNAFMICYALDSVYYPAINPIESNQNIFYVPNSDRIYSQATLYVPAEAVEKCKEINPWKNFHTIEAYDFSGIEYITSDLSSDVPYEVFSLNGIKVGNSVKDLAPGMYIVRQGTVLKKIIM